MPHIIVEYSKNLEKNIDIPALISDMHNKLSDQGIDKARIKSRAIACDNVVVGDKGANEGMIHATLLILEGRDLETKKTFGDPLYEIMKSYAPKDCSTTLEIRDMNPQTYYM